MIVQFPENLPQGEMYMNFLDGTFTVGSSESKITKSTEQGTITVNIDSVFSPAYTKLEISPKESEISQVVMGVHMMELVSAPVTEVDVARETNSDPTQCWR